MHGSRWCTPTGGGMQPQNSGSLRAEWRLSRIDATATRDHAEPLAEAVAPRTVRASRMLGNAP